MAKAPARPKAITKLSEGASFRNWLIYGDSGAGKTVLAGTAPKGLFLTVEAEGTESARARGSTADEWQCDAAEELREAYQWLKAGGTEEYAWVMMDSISEMEELLWSEHLQAMAKAKPGTRSVDKPALEDYQIIGNRVKRMIDQFNRLPINTLYTAQVMRRSVEDEDGDDVELRQPLLGSTRNGVLSQKVCGMVTLVGLLIPDKFDEDNPDEYHSRLWVAGSERYLAKDRHDTFGRFIQDPNIEEMDKEVTARKTGEKATATAAEPVKKKKQKSAASEDKEN
jgi:hypothetical protein